MLQIPRVGRATRAGVGSLLSWLYDAHSGDRKTMLSGRKWHVHSTRDSQFRKLVKKYCELPSYLGLALFRLAQKTREVFQKLVENKHLPRPLTRTDCHQEELNLANDSKLSVRDFLRFWTPEIQQAHRRKRFVALLIPPSKQTVMELESSTLPMAGRRLTKDSKIPVRNLKPLIEALIYRHPDLSDLTKRKKLRRRYIAFVLTNIASCFNGLTTRTISLRDIDHSNLVHTLYRCACRSLDSMTNFSVTHFRRLHEVFVELSRHTLSSDTDVPVENSSDTADVDVVRDMLDLGIADVVHERLFTRATHSLGMKHRVTFDDFLTLTVAKEDRMQKWSIKYWFSVLDLDDDGYLGEDDVLQLFESKRRAIVDHGFTYEGPSLSQVMRLIQDLIGAIRLSNHNVLQLSALGLRKSGAGGLLFDILVDIQRYKELHDD
eukprot:gb/GECG01001001.1/.p1 GENE.gb/GECG01001001.1/~~gb/GECG01001001.1/.p1  ORF type:complete len:433 (+),score=35.26 gb/GECG01001001.1/:1-1299(+)